MNKKGFTLLEILLVTIVLIVIFLLSIPVMLKIINTSKIKSFKSSVLNVFDSVEFYIANNEFIDIGENGIQIENNENLRIKRNEFDKGLMIKNKSGKLELLYLIDGDFCAKGTEEKLLISDSGCGKLDDTKPKNVKILKYDSSNNSITVFAKVEEKESNIIKYYYSIDGKNYMESTSNKYIFDNITGEHTFKVKVENEAGLISESEEIKLETLNNEKIECSIKGNKIDVSKNINCTYPKGDGYIYQYKIDEEYKNNNGNKFVKEITTNSKIELRVLKDDKIVTKLSVNFNNIDDTLNGAYPELLDNMIPVIYDKNTNTYRKVSSDSIYWNYKNKEWANAVIVKKYKTIEDEKSNSREYYMSDEAVGKVIYEKDIIGTFVWIPRFKYKLFNVLGMKNEINTIDVIFENNKSELLLARTLNQNGEYLTHPAFSFGNKELNGFWVSKYQASYDENSTCYNLPTISNCNKNDDSSLYFIKDRNSITNISVSNAFNLSLKLKNNALYRINGDSHLIKNTEWGAIAYLSQSIYGNNGKNIIISTTGNETGVFNMDSPIYEMVMGNYNKDAGLDEEKNSGFKPYGNNSFPEEKYYDLYTSITEKGMILGDATGEVIGFSNINNFVNGSNPFFIRGGANNIFDFSSYTGEPKENVTFRVVLVND